MSRINRDIHQVYAKVISNALDQCVKIHNDHPLVHLIEDREFFRRGKQFLVWIEQGPAVDVQPEERVRDIEERIERLERDSGNT